MGAEENRPQTTACRPIHEVAGAAGLLESEVHAYGRYRAKVDLGVLQRLSDRTDGRIVIVTGITPTKAGEGKTTSAISLTQGLGRLQVRAALCLREPSVGPVFGNKGGGTGGGLAQIVPMEEVNLHFNGDIHAVAAAHNLLATVIDATLYHDRPIHIDPASISWPRTVDINDRALRNVIVGLGGRAHGTPRESGFIITAASEVMAILALATDLGDLRRRLGRILVAQDRDGSPVSADQLRLAGAMTILLKEALLPNLVQTIEGQPAFVHAGPFGNIAHANNSLLADRVALKLADVVCTEAGFGSDLGLEKFCHIVCRYGRIQPSAALLVATGRALKVHGGVSERASGTEDIEALKRGAANLAAHLGIVRAFGLPCVVGINRFPTDTDRELELVRNLALEFGADDAVVNDGFGQGGAGAEAMAAAVLRATELPNRFAPLYSADATVREQLDLLARKVYGADGVSISAKGNRQLERLGELGLDKLPVCIAKTPFSISHDPALKGRPHGFTLPVRDLYPSVGAGFVVALCGDIQLLPGLGTEAAYSRMDVDAEGQTIGLV